MSSSEKERWLEFIQLDRIKTTVLLIVVCILAANLVNHGGTVSSNFEARANQAANYILTPSQTPNATISVQPNATIDTTKSLTQFTIQLSLNNTPGTPGIQKFNGVQTVLTYDSHVLTAISLDYSTNVLSQTGSAPAVVADCLDGVPAGGPALCGSNDGPGTTSFAETVLGGSAPDGTEGNIYYLTLKVNTTGIADPKGVHFSQLQIAQGSISYGSQAYPVIPKDGYYTSQNIGKPAVAQFTWSPQPVKQEQLAIFNASASLPSTGATITDYFWDFKDPQAIITYRDTKTNSTATWVFQLAGNYQVTLRITDSNGVKVSTSNLVRVINANVDMGIDSIAVQPGYSGLHAGVVFTITAILKNYGGLPENTTMTITLAAGNKILNTTSVTNMRPSSTMSLKATWDSTGYAPNVYRIDASTPLVRNESSTDHNPNERSYWVQLVPLQPGGSLSLLSTAGLSVLVLGAGGAGVSFIRKRSRNVDDSL